MLEVTIPSSELFDSRTNHFIKIPETTLRLEHSLVSVHKWEQKWHLRFLSPSTKMTNEQALDYIRCMTTTRNVDQNVYYALTKENMNDIFKYIEDPATATTFPKGTGSGVSNGEEISAELIYYWMTAYNISWEAERWHLNSLLALIRIANVKSKPAKKMSNADTLRQYSALNAARRSRMHSKG